MICPKCGSREPDGSKFCSKCGAKLFTEEVTAEVKEADEAVAEEAEEAGAAEVAEADGTVEAVAAEEMSAGDMADEAVAAEEDDEIKVEETLGAEQAIAGAQAVTESAPTMTAGTASAGANAAAGAAGATAAKAGLSLPVVFGLIGGGIFLVAAVITLVIVFAFNGNDSEAIQLSDYTKVDFDGTDGEGKARAYLDMKELSIRFAKDMGIDTSLIRDVEKNPEDADYGAIFKEGIENFGQLMDIYSAISGIKLELDKDSGLKNGDTIHVSYKINEKRIEKVKTKVLGDTKTVTVSGLNEVKAVDPFEHVNVEVDGVSPKAYVFCDCDSTEDYMLYVNFTAEPTDNLKLGDTVKIKVGGYDEKEFLDRFGLKFSRTEMDYKLEKVDAYLTENTALEQGAIDKMKTATEEYVNQYFEDSNRKKEISGSDIKYVGYYFLTNKNTDQWSGYNKVYMVYSASVSSKEKPKGFKTSTVYFPVEYDDIKKLADGSYDIETSYRRILGSTDLKYGFWQMVDGYSSIDTMYDELVTADEADYQGAGYDGLAG